MKTFGKYLLLVIAFYIVSNLLAYFCIETTYSNIEKQIEQTENINLTIEKAEATIINGKISGTITNNSEQSINSKYIIKYSIQYLTYECGYTPFLCDILISN